MFLYPNTEGAVCRTPSKLNIPACDDSSSEDGVLNEKIKNRRIQLVVLRAANQQENVLCQVKVILQFLADPTRSLNNQQAINLVVLSGQQGSPVQSIPFQGNLQPTVVLILSIPKKKQSKQTQMQRLANPKSKSNMPTSSPFTKFPTSMKGGEKQKRKIVEL